MARPAVTDKRKEEILLAYENCIAKFGVHGATLAEIAKEAGVSRPLVRHHVGNQDELLEQAIERFVERTRQMLKDTPPTSFSDNSEFVEMLFGSKSRGADKDTLVANAFVSASATDETVRIYMGEWLRAVGEWFYGVILHHNPGRSDEKLRAVAAGVMGIYFNIDSLAPIEVNIELREQSRTAAYLLINSL